MNNEKRNKMNAKKKGQKIEEKKIPIELINERKTENGKKLKGIDE